MKAMVIDRFGGPEVLHPADIERPAAGPGNVVVKVAYAGVNPADWKAREGWLAAYFDYRFPFVVGFDASGVVDEVGEGVEGLAVGDRVVTSGNQGLGERGSYAQYMRAAAERTVRLPPTVGLAEAATLPTAGMTAWEATLDVGKATAGATVVVNGGSGGTGGFAIQLARLAGARVAAVCSARNFAYVGGLGADHAIDYRQGGVVGMIRAWATQGVDLVVDTVGQGTLIDIVPAMKRGGIVAPIVTLIAGEPAIDPAEAQAAGVTVIPTISNVANQPRQLRGLVEALADRRLKPPEHAVMPLAQAGEAQRLIQAGHVRGKILLEVDASLERAPPLSQHALT